MVLHFRSRGCITQGLKLVLLQSLGFRLQVEWSTHRAAAVKAMNEGLRPEGRQAATRVWKPKSHHPTTTHRAVRDTPSCRLFLLQRPMWPQATGQGQWRGRRRGSCASNC